MEVLIFILFVVVAIVGNKGKRDAKKRQAEARRNQPPAYTPPPTANSLPGGAFEWLEDIFTPQPQPGAQPYAPPYAQPASGSLSYDSSEGLGADGGGSSLEGMASLDSREGLSLRGSSLSTLTHVVRPFTEGDHSHTESSITGDIPCPPARESALQAGAQALPSLGLRLDAAGVRQGILYAEILGKPRALQGRAVR